MRVATVSYFNPMFLFSFALKLEIKKKVLFAAVICPICHFPEEENDEANGIKWVGCDRVESHWWHRDCLSDLQQTLLEQQEEWECPLCQEKVNFICDICMGAEKCYSQSVNWVSCTSCNSNFHTQCLSGGILLEAIAMSNWECMRCERWQ